MKVLLAGASGYIGSRVHRNLSGRAGVEVLGLVGRSPVGGAMRQIDLRTELRKLSEIARSFKPDVVINAVGTTSADPQDCIEAHVLVTANLLRVMGAELPGARFVQIGSAAEYGQAVPHPDRVDEETTPRPLTAYGVSKLASTLLTLAEGAAAQLDCIVLRIFNLIGPGMKPGTIVPRVMSFLADPDTQPDDPIHLGRLDVYRDFVHVDDVVAAIDRAAAHRASGTACIVNVASGEPVLVRDLVRRILDAAGHPGSIVEDGPAGERSVGVSWQRASIRRAREILAWQPTMTLSDAIRDLVKHGDIVKHGNQPS